MLSNKKKCPIFQWRIPKQYVQDYGLWFPKVINEGNDTEKRKWNNGRPEKISNKNLAEKRIW